MICDFTWSQCKMLFYPTSLVLYLLKRFLDMNCGRLLNNTNIKWFSRYSYSFILGDTRTRIAINCTVIRSIRLHAYWGRLLNFYTGNTRFVHRTRNTRRKKSLYRLRARSRWCKLPAVRCQQSDQRRRLTLRRRSRRWLHTLLLLHGLKRWCAHDKRSVFA